MASPQLDALTAAVTAEETVDGSAVKLITDLAALIEANKTDPVALQALADRLNASAATLSAAITANTPAA